MITKSPSGALSPYYYKGGYFHGIHYGSYFDDTDALFAIMDAEQAFILKSPEKRRILIDLYETVLTDVVVERLIAQINALDDKIFKLAFATEKKDLARLRRALKKAGSPVYGRCRFGTDMEDDKTWLVSDQFD